LPVPAFWNPAVGLLKRGVLVSPKASARHCNPNRSVNLKVRNMLISRLKNPGPRTVSRPTLPNTGPDGAEKTLGSKYEHVRSPVLQPGRGVAPMICTGPLWFAVSVFPAAPKVPLGAVMVKGEPLTLLSTQLVCQPPRIWFQIPLVAHSWLRPNGRSYVP